jgi:tagatose 1,6-diphosphate aldolase
MLPISLGKIRSLQACSTPEGVFAILAADHRDALRVQINPQAPESVTGTEITSVKLAIVSHLAPQATAVLLDPVYSAAQLIGCGALPGHVGLLTALEEQGYLGDPYARQTTMLEGWSIEKAKRLGANGVKVLLFYHPDAGEATERQDQLVSTLVEQCRRHDIPFFLEPISYPLDPNIDKRSTEFASTRRRVVIESARRLSKLGIDVLKAEFPIDARHDADRASWADACAELTEAINVPWALLSADEPFETFKDQVEIACKFGCSGFLAGRAVWKEAATLRGDSQSHFLQSQARRRFDELAEVAQRHAKPWYTCYQMPKIDESWYRE